MRPFPLIQLDSAHKGALALFVALMLAYLFVLPPAWQEYFDYYFIELALLATLVALLLRSWRHALNRSTRTFFGLLSIALSTWLLVRLTSFVFPDQSIDAFELEKDIVFLVFFSIMMATIELRLDTRADDQWLLRRVSAALGSVLIVLAVFGYFAILPLASSEKPYASLLSLHAAFDGYLALRFLIVAVQAVEKSWRTLYGLLALAFLLIFWADVLAWLFTAGILSYQPGNVIDLSWFFWYPIAMLATAVKPIGTEKSLDLTEPEDIFPNTNGLLLFGLALPLIHVVGYAFDLFAAEARQSRDIFVAVWLFAIAAMFVGLYRFVRDRVDALEQKRANAEVKAEQFEEQLNRELRFRSLGRLSAGLAHDFGNTMAALEMHAVAAERRIELGESSTQELEGVKKSIQYAKNMVAQLKLFGAVDERVHTESLDLNAEIQKTMSLIAPSLHQGATISFRPTADEIIVQAQKSMLHQVTTNYVYNAIDSIGYNGTIDVQTEIADVSATCRSCGEYVVGRYAALSVSDSGPGVSASIAENVFEPLITTKPLGLGSGLGLSSVHGIMHKIGGHVGLMASDAGGACFVAYFLLGEPGSGARPP